MDLSWVSYVDSAELNEAMEIIRAEMAKRDKAKAQKLISAIDNAIRDFLDEYPSACWMVEIEDYDGFPHEVNLFDYDLDTNLIIT